MNPGMSAAQTPEVAQFAALIRGQVDAEVQQIARDAEQRAQRVRAAADAEVAAIEAEARRAGEARGRRQASAVVAAAETRSHHEWLWARERLLQDVLTRVAAQLAELPPRADTAAQLVRLADEALRMLPSAAVRIRVRDGFAALVEAALQGGSAVQARQYRVEAAVHPSTAGVADGLAGGGVIVEIEDGRLCFDNSFAARMRRQRDTLRGAAAAVLFAE